MRKEMMRHASERLHRIAHAPMRGEHHEIGSLPFGELEQRLPFVHVACDDRAHPGRAWQSRAEMLEIPLRA